MRICTTKAKSTHTSKPTFVDRRPGQTCCWYHERRSIKRYIRIKAGKMEVGWNLAMLEDKHGLDQSGHPGCCLRMTNIGFYSTEHTRLFRYTICHQYRFERLRFDR